MRYIYSNNKNEPDCLRALRDSGKNSYKKDLQGECKENVRNALSFQQNGFCAYCEQRFQSTVFIEHYKPQSSKKDVLNFDNFLGVCSGKFYLDLKNKSKKHIPHCGNSRGNTPVLIDPRNKNHIKTIYYDKYNAIKSTNPDFDYDLDKTLNLNFPQIKDLRNSAFKQNLNNLLEVVKLKRISKKDAYCKGFKSAIRGKFEFSGFLAYRYKKLLTKFS